MRDIMLGQNQNPLAQLLVVDAEPAIRSSLTLVLSVIGYSVRSATDGFSAFSQIRTDPPHILLTDLDMPGMSGYALLSQVRDRFPAILAIAMSGSIANDEASCGGLAHAFHRKGRGVGSLLKIIHSLQRTERRSRNSTKIDESYQLKSSDHDLISKSQSENHSFRCQEFSAEPLEDLLG